MSDINLIIEEAADKLTKNERKQRGKKENYTESELKDMLVLQKKERDENRDALAKKLSDICEKTQREFKISYVSAGMMQKVALQISKEISNETITSLQNVEKCGGVIKTLHEEATKIQLIENYEAILEGRKPPHETIPYYSDSAKLIASNPEIANAIDLLNSKNEIDDKVDNILRQFNEMNADKIAEELRYLMQTDEFKTQEQEHAKIASVALIVAENTEEQRIACEDVEHQEASTRCRLNPDSDDAFIGLMYNYMTRLNMKNLPADRIIADMKLHLLSNEKLTINQRVELNELINNYEKQKNPQMLLEFLADRIVELNPHIKREDTLEAAKNAALADLDPSRIDQNFLKSQARVLFRDDDDYIGYCDLANEIYSLGENSQEIDWEKIENVRGKSSNLYAMTLAALNQKTKDLDDKSLHEKTQDLIKKYAEEEKYATRNDAVNVKARQNGKTASESLYWIFSRTIMDSPESLESMKKSRIESIKQLDDLTPEEKAEEIKKVEQIQTVEDAIEYGVQGVAREKVKQGKEADIDAIRKNLIGKQPETSQEKLKQEVKHEHKEQKAKSAAILKASTIRPEYYERYLKTMEMLGHVKKDAELEIDGELLDYLREYAPENYQELSSAYTASSNHTLRDAMQRRLNDERHRAKLKENHRDESEKSAEVKSQTIQRDTEKVEDRQAVLVKKVEDAVVIEGDEIVAEGESPTILQAVEGVIEDVVSTLTEPTTFIGTANPTKKIEDDELER